MSGSNWETAGSLEVNANDLRKPVWRLIVRSKRSCSLPWPGVGIAEQGSSLGRRLNSSTAEARELPHHSPPEAAVLSSLRQLVQKTIDGNNTTNAKPPPSPKGRPSAHRRPQRSRRKPSQSAAAGPARAPQEHIRKARKIPVRGDYPNAPAPLFDPKKQTLFLRALRKICTFLTSVTPRHGGLYRVTVDCDFPGREPCVFHGEGKDKVRRWCLMATDRH